MARVSNHEDLAELLGAYALDAVEPGERDLVERHLEVCPRCRAEVAEHREVAGLLGFAGQDAPAGLWDRIVTSMQEPPPTIRLARIDRFTSEEVVGASSAVVGAVGPGNLEVTGAGPSLTGNAVVSIDRAGAARRARRPGRSSPAGRRSWGTRALAGVAAAAVIAVAVLAVQVVRLEHQTGQINQMVTADTPTMALVRRALAVPGSRRVVLTSFGGSTASLDAVILPSGQGYVYHEKLAPLDSHQTYQLWGLVGPTRISYGILGASPARVEAFVAGPGVQALAVTTEVADGVPSSTHPPVAIGSLPS